MRRRPCARVSVSAGRIGRAQRITGLEYALCSLIVLFGASIRVTGLTSGDLWADDAWITLPVRVGLREAIRMDVSTPLFVLLLREWASVDVASTPFVQLLPLLASLLAIAAVWWLVRTVGGRMWTRVLVTTLAAVNPMAVVYATRVKEYSIEELLGVLLLITLVKTIQRPAPGRLMALLGLSVVACVTSGALVLFVAGILIAATIQGLRTGLQRDRFWLATVFGTALAMGASYLIFYNHIPPLLNAFWSPFEVSSLNQFPLTHTAGLIGNGIAHGFVGVPLQVGPFPYTYQLSNAGFAVALATAAVVFVFMIALMAGALWITRAGLTGAGTAAIASTSVILIAMLASVTGHVPLGGGRTDLWWYPAAWCLIAIVLEAAFTMFDPLVARQSTHGRKLITIASSILLVVIVVPFGIDNRSWYPAQDVRALVLQHRAEIRPTDWIDFSSYNSWSWALYGLGPFHIWFNRGKVHTEKGWVVVNDKFDVQQILNTDPSSICTRTRRIWWIGVNSSANNPSSYRLSGPSASVINPPGSVFTKFLSLGWQESQLILGQGVHAILYTHPGTCRRTRS